MSALPPLALSLPSLHPVPRYPRPAASDAAPPPPAIPPPAIFDDTEVSPLPPSPPPPPLSPHFARCSICLEVLNMPVVLSCTHRFCYGCLSSAALHSETGACPLCNKATELDPSNYEIDPVLNRFVTSHFLRSPKKGSRVESPASVDAGAPPSLSATSEAAPKPPPGKPPPGKPPPAHESAHESAHGAVKRAYSFDSPPAEQMTWSKPHAGVPPNAPAHDYAKASLPPSGVRSCAGLDFVSRPVSRGEAWRTGIVAPIPRVASAEVVHAMADVMEHNLEDETTTTKKKRAMDATAGALGEQAADDEAMGKPPPQQPPSSSSSSADAHASTVHFPSPVALSPSLDPISISAASISSDELFAGDSPSATPRAERISSSPPPTDPARPAHNKQPRRLCGSTTGDGASRSPASAAAAAAAAQGNEISALLRLDKTSRVQEMVRRANEALAARGLVPTPSPGGPNSASSPGPNAPPPSAAPASASATTGQPSTTSAAGLPNPLPNGLPNPMALPLDAPGSCALPLLSRLGGEGAYHALMSQAAAMAASSPMYAAGASLTTANLALGGGSASHHPPIHFSASSSLSARSTATTTAEGAKTTSGADNNGSSRTAASHRNDESQHAAASLTHPLLAPAAAPSIESSTATSSANAAAAAAAAAAPAAAVDTKDDDRSPGGNGDALPKTALRKRACVECHKAKSACEGDPCTRCVRLGKHCVTEERKRRRRSSAAIAAAATASKNMCARGASDPCASAHASTSAPQPIRLTAENAHPPRGGSLPSSANPTHVPAAIANPTHAFGGHAGGAGSAAFGGSMCADPSVRLSMQLEALRRASHHTAQQQQQQQQPSMPMLSAMTNGAMTNAMANAMTNAINSAAAGHLTFGGAMASHSRAPAFHASNSHAFALQGLMDSYGEGDAAIGAPHREAPEGCGELRGASLHASMHRATSPELEPLPMPYEPPKSPAQQQPAGGGDILDAYLDFTSHDVSQFLSDLSAEMDASA